MLVLSSLIFLAVTLGLVLPVADPHARRTAPAGHGRAGRKIGLDGNHRQGRRPAGQAASRGRLGKFALAIALSACRYYRNPDARLLYFAAKTVLPLALAGLTYVAFRGMGDLTFLFYILTAALLGCYLPNLVILLSIRSRQREIFETFPDAADLMLVCVEAGLGLDAGLTRVADEIRRKSTALAEELHLTNLEIRAGGTRDKSLRNLALRTGVEEIGTFATMLTQADKFGTSIGDSLRVFSDDLRHKRQMRAEESAAKVPTKMLIPLVTCIFPAVIMVILGPAIIQIVRTILPMLSWEAERWRKNNRLSAAAPFGRPAAPRARAWLFSWPLLAADSTLYVYSLSSRARTCSAMATPIRTSPRAGGFSSTG